VTELAKDRLDVGLYTNRVDELRQFYGETLGLPYEELLKVGGGVHQHRYGLRGSVCKINAARADLSDAPTGFRRLLIARDGLSQPLELIDPDGLSVTLVPAGREGIADIAVQWVVRDPDRLGALLADGFDAVEEGEGRWRIGTTLLVLSQDPGALPVEGMFARGFRYLTVQVRDVKKEHQHLLDVGWTEGRAPVKLGETAYISFVRDPDGSWIEVSQRASLTGPLPD
jgi:lactoylglutathione lyase